jgi:hypothetical protein
MRIFDRLKDAVRRKQDDEVRVVMEDAEQEHILKNRWHRRMDDRDAKLRGPGYTRSMRKGRTQRERA